jgi:hypothetical protein
MRREEIAVTTINDCKTDTLFLLVGGNPLPNYVAAQLLADQDTTIVLVYSSGVPEQLEALETELPKKGLNHLETLEIEESNPIDIVNKMEERVNKCTGKVGLHYTGGTKTMATHAYRAVEKVCKQRSLHVCYSYLDARTLKLVVEGTGITNSPALHVASTAVRVSIKELLNLHQRTLKSFTDKPLWTETATALATVHSDTVQANAWRKWTNETLIDQEQKHKRKWKNKTQLEEITFSLPDEVSHVAPILLKETGLNEPVTMREIMRKSGFRKSEDFGKWMEGTWLESYILHQINQIQDTCAIHEAATSIVSIINADFEIDVCAIRGYRLFAISCTTSTDRSTCKSKLLEAIVRAEQLGGAEARTALVCYFENPSNLQEEIRGLFQGENRIRVFGQHHLPNIKQELMEWFNEP